MPVFILIGILTLALLGLMSPLRRAEEMAAGLTGGAFLFSLSALWLPSSPEVAYGLRLGDEALLFATVISFISLVIQAYSLRHFDGHRYRRRVFRCLVVLTLSLLVFAIADHLLLLAVALGISNFLLSRLIALQGDWKASRVSGRLAWRSLGTAAVLLLLVAGLVYFREGHWSLQKLDRSALPGWWIILAVGPVLVAALLQSAIWPFHRWLIASANAPTPVSAFMHAGLVNGGALILYKFAPLLRQLPWSWTVLFWLGAGTAVLGTLWMLVQSDVKRTLTCSTMGQMGFMIMQCGLGLFPAAIAHMVWHGFFKASLFLSAGSAVKAAKNQSLRLEGPFALPVFLFGVLAGVAGAFIFWQFTGDAGSLNTSYLMLLVFCGLTCAHAVMTILQTRPGPARAALALVLGLLGATVYGGSVWLVESRLAPLTGAPLNGWHLAVLAFFVLGWLVMIFRAYLPGSFGERLLAPLYVRALLGSQPARTAMTFRRSNYRI